MNDRIFNVRQRMSLNRRRFKSSVQLSTLPLLNYCDVRRKHIVKFRAAFFVGAAALVLQPAEGGQYFYSVDFAPPLHQIGQPPTINAGPRTPSSIVFGSPTVVASFDAITNYALLFPAFGYQQIQFDLARNAPDYFLDFDFETRGLYPSLFDYAILFDVPYVQVFDLHGRDGICVPPSNSDCLPAWTDSQFHHLHILADLTNNTWTLQLDDRAPASGPFSWSVDPQSLRINLGEWRFGTPNNTNIQVAISNVRIGTLARAPAPRIACTGPLVRDCVDSFVTLNANVQDSSTSPLKIVWTADGRPYQTNTLPPGTALTPTNVTLTTAFGLGEHIVSVSASNGEAAPAECSTQVNIRDATPPVISEISATPEALWPPNRKMVPINISVSARDDCGPTASRIISVQSTDPSHSNEPGNAWQITGDLILNLRAIQGTVYTVLIECQDRSGNTSQASVIVPVTQFGHP
jgi:hypothetical protein